jgi:hypothetical protein
VGSGTASTPRPAAPARGRWISGVVSDDPTSFGRWRGEPVAIAGMYADASVAAQAQQWQFTHSRFTGDIDLAVGGPIDRTWAQAAKGSERARWVRMASRLRSTWHCRTLNLRYAHEANGDWMPWSVSPKEVDAFRTTFRLFAATMRHELAGRRVRIVFGPNFGSWRYSPDTMWPGDDVVDVVGLSLYEWQSYATEAAWETFAFSDLGPDHWLEFAAGHGKPLALSEWGARSPFFLARMNAWIAANAGAGGGHLEYDVYMNDHEFAVKGKLASTYRSLSWGR